MCNDATGNRTSQTVGGTTRTYTTAPTSNRLTAIDSGPPKSYTFDANGSITGDGASSVVGVRVEVGNTGIQISNDGDIIGNPSDGLWNEGTITQVTNRGRIGAGPFALGVYSTGTITVLNNEAGAEIQAGAGSVNGIESFGTLGTLNNAGHILGGIRPGNTTISLSGGSARITGPVNVVGTNGSVNVVSGAVFSTKNTPVGRRLGPKVCEPHCCPAFWSIPYGR